MSPQTTSQLLMQEVDNLLKDGGEAIAERTCSIFFEDSKSPSAKVQYVVDGDICAFEFNFLSFVCYYFVLFKDYPSESGGTLSFL